MSKRLRGFTLVEALVIMTVVAVLLAATTRLVTRKALNAPEKNMHGRYEAYYDDNGDARHVYFNGSGKIVREEPCDNSEITKAANGKRAVCTFVPPSGAQNFHVQAVGGGGAGGSAGGSGTDKGDGEADKDNTKRYDSNRGKYRTIVNSKTPFNQYLDLRTYNENNEEVGPVGVQVPDRGPTANSNAGRFKVSVLTNESSEFYAKFPAPTEWFRVLGSSKTKPEPGNVPNWFNWKAIEEGRVAKPTGTAGKIGIFEVIASACSSAGGDGGNFTWTTKADYAALRTAYTVFGRTTATKGTECTKLESYTSTVNGVSTTKHRTVGAGTWPWTLKRTCGVSSSHYRCNSATQTYGPSGCLKNPPSFNDPCDKVSHAPKQAVDFVGKIQGQEASGKGVPVRDRGSIIDPAQWGCAMVDALMAPNMKASTKLSNKQKKVFGRHEMAENDGKLERGADLTYNGVGPTDTRHECVSFGPNGVTGTAQINNSIAKATGGRGGKIFCPEQQTVPCTVDADGEPLTWKCEYKFAGPYYGCSLMGAAPGGQVVATTPQHPFNGGPNPFLPPAADGKLTGKSCEIKDGFNYCRTGIYNYEYSYEMARGYKQLAYGDVGGPGKIETQTIGQIKEPVKIVLGKGGEWEPDGKDKGKWNKDATSTGPAGSATIVGDYLTIDGGEGGKGALKSDKYELCSIYDKGHCKFNNPHGIDQHFRIQPGAKGEATTIDTNAPNSKLAGKTPGKGGNSMGTISTSEFICNKRAIYNLMATNGSPYNGAFKYNGYKIVEAFSPKPYPASDDKYCATQASVGNEYYFEPDANKAGVGADGNPVAFRRGANVKNNLKKELKGDDAAVIITW